MDKQKRITKKLNKPNPLFEKWLMEWRDKAKQNDSKMQHCFSAALRSLKKYPLPFKTGKDCKILKGFGDKLCKMLDEKLAEHRRNVAVPIGNQIQLPQNNVVNNVVLNTRHNQLINDRMDKNINNIENNPKIVPTIIDCNKKAPKKRKNIEQTTSSQESNSDPPRQEIIFAPASFAIILLIDTSEVGGKDELLIELRRLNLRFEVRNLNVGDYIWICRNDTQDELILPYIIERKRMDDFGKSIKDGRFHEQKFRLKQSAIENLIYLIESHGKNKFVGLPMSTLYQAAINTAIQDGFTVKFTNGLKDTAEYLSCFTNHIMKLYQNKTLINCTKDDIKPINLEDDLIFLLHFVEFNKSGTKTKHFKVKEMFIRQLVQLKGMSVDRALAITDKYPTPLLLKLAFDSVPVVQREKFLSNLQWGGMNKNLGPILSKSISQLFCNKTFV